MMLSQVADQGRRARRGRGLLLENNLIRASAALQHPVPDDKSYNYLTVTARVPASRFTGGRPANRYFGTFRTRTRSRRHPALQRVFRAHLEDTVFENRSRPALTRSGAAPRLHRPDFSRQYPRWANACFPRRARGTTSSAADRENETASTPQPTRSGLRIATSASAFTSEARQYVSPTAAWMRRRRRASRAASLRQPGDDPGAPHVGDRSFFRRTRGSTRGVVPFLEQHYLDQRANAGRDK